MLVLNVKRGGRLVFDVNGEQFEVQVVEVESNKVRLGIDASPVVKVYREEVFRRMQGEKKCNCGADRTGPSAEAHDSTCPAK
jgi:carbon storage regulator